MHKISSIILILICSVHAHAEILGVPDEYTTIQSAINDANDGDTILVGQGRYKENINFLGKAITITSFTPDDPNVVKATIIDGNCPDDPNFASVVTFCNEEDANSILIGFTITGGTGSWLPVSWQYKGVNWNRCGGGVLCYNMAQPTIMFNIFRNNSAGQGGAIYVYGDPVNPETPTNPPVHIKPMIDRNIFFNNDAVTNHGFNPPDTNYPCNDHGDGGAIVCFQGVDPTIVDNTIEQNYASFYGGAIHLRQWSDGIIMDNHIAENNSQLGGGIHITYNSSPVVYENTIEANIARGLGGGGVYIYAYSNPIISSNTIISNDAKDAKGGGIGAYYDSNPNICNNIIAKNNAHLGGGIYSINHITISHNTIANNTADIGSGIYLETGIECYLTCNNIAKNKNAAQFHVNTNTIGHASFNNVWNENGQLYSGTIANRTGIQGNISKDPKFISPDANDFRLSVYSQCINAGDPNSIPPEEIKDINGKNRLMGQRIDIGADEAMPVWNVTSDTKYLNIQNAIDDAADTDTIIVSRGKYYENITFNDANIVLSSADPNTSDVVENTIIDANYNSTAITIAGSQDQNTILAGFTIQNGYTTDNNAGGIWCSASPTIKNNLIKDCYTYNKGGAIYLTSNDCNANVTSNYIFDNYAQNGAGIYCDADSAIKLNDNVLSNNYAASNGGAVHIASGAKKTTLCNNKIENNTADRGAGIYSENDQLEINSNILYGNIAFTGGAISIAYSDAQIINNTIHANRAILGAGIFLQGSNSLILNNIITYADIGEGIYAWPDAQYPSEPNVLYNNVFANSTGNYSGTISDQTGINGNITQYPNFLELGYWDDSATPSDLFDDILLNCNLHLLPASGCINAGDPNTNTLTTMDIDSEDRIFQDIIDIGADEFHLDIHDLNNDGTVNNDDLSLLLTEWLHESQELNYDLVQDNIVNFKDYAELLKHWNIKLPWHQ